MIKIFMKNGEKTDRWPLTIFYENGLDTPHLNEPKEKILAALKLQELVKVHIKKTLASPLYDKNTFSPCIKILESLVNESENTDKEKGIAR